MPITFFYFYSRWNNFSNKTSASRPKNISIDYIVLVMKVINQHVPLADILCYLRLRSIIPTVGVGSVDISFTWLSYFHPKWCHSWLRGRKDKSFMTLCSRDLYINISCRAPSIPSRGPSINDVTRFWPIFDPPPPLSHVVTKSQTPSNMTSQCSDPPLKKHSISLQLKHKIIIF